LFGFEEGANDLFSGASYNGFACAGQGFGVTDLKCQGKDVTIHCQATSQRLYAEDV
jgi:hypothetical protein